MNAAVIPEPVRAPRRRLRRAPAPALHQRRMVRGAERRDLRGGESGDRAQLRRRCRRRRRRHRRRGEGRTRRLREPEVDAHGALGARAPAAQARRCARGQRRGTGAARDARQRHAADAGALRQRPGRCREPPLPRRLGDQAQRRDDRPERTGRVARLHAARAGRRRWPDRSLEFPARDGAWQRSRAASRPAAPWCSSPPSRRRCRRSAWAS